MRSAAAVALVLTLLTACARPVGPFAPRRTGTPDHRAARAVEDCRECHDPAELPRHGGLNDCLRCHRLAPGG